MKTIVSTITEKAQLLKIIATKKSAKEYRNIEFNLKDFVVYEKGENRISAIIADDENGQEIIFSTSSNAIADTLELIYEIFDKKDNAIRFKITTAMSKHDREYNVLEIL